MEKALSRCPVVSLSRSSWDWNGRPENIWKTNHCRACYLGSPNWTGRRKKVPGNGMLLSATLHPSAPASCSTDVPRGETRSRALDLISAVAGKEFTQHFWHDGVQEFHLDAAATEEESIAGPRTSSTNSFQRSYQGLKRRFGGTELILHYLEERDEGVLSKRLVSLCRANRLVSALELFFSTELAGLESNQHACNSLLACILRKGSMDDALRFFETMKEKGLVTGHSYTLILKEAARRRGYRMALDLFLGMEKEGLSKGNIDLVVYNTVLSICAKWKRWNEAEKLWRKLKENGFCGTELTYSLLISTFVQCSQTELAYAAYVEMLQEGITPGEDDMKAMIAACTKEGNWSAALNILQRMLDDGIKPDFVALNALIHCLGKAGEPDLVLKIFDLMKSFGHVPDSYTWNALFGALYRNQLYADCILLFERINNMPDSDMNVHHYNTTLMSCQKLGKWERSLQLVWQMEQKGMEVPTESYNFVIGACEKAKNPKVALQVFDHMVHRNCKPDTFTYLSVLRACIWGSLWTEVDCILEDVGPNASIYNALVHGLFLKGKITAAKRLYDKMQDIGLKSDSKTRAFMLQHMHTNKTRIQRRWK